MHFMGRGFCPSALSITRRGYSTVVKVGKAHRAWREEDCFLPVVCIKPLAPSKATKGEGPVDPVLTNSFTVGGAVVY